MTGNLQLGIGHDHVRYEALTEKLPSVESNNIIFQAVQSSNRLVMANFPLLTASAERCWIMEISRY